MGSHAALLADEFIQVDDRGPPAFGLAQAPPRGQRIAGRTDPGRS